MIKIVWLSFFILSLGGCGYFFIISLTNYFNYQAVVQISVIKQYPTYFPAVTICNLNPFNLKHTETQEYINKLLQLSNYSYMANISMYDSIRLFARTNNTNEILTDVSDLLKRLISTDPKPIPKRQLLGFDLENDMLVSCSFNKANCNSTSFSSFLSYNYGNCYTFNSGVNLNEDILKTSKVGHNYGLQLELVVGSPLTQVKYTAKNGLYLLVHNQTQQAITIDDDDGIFVPTGYETYVSVKREFR
jgi:hypothetical protein